MMDVAFVCTASGLSRGTAGVAVLVYDREVERFRVTQTSVHTSGRDKATLAGIVASLRWYLAQRPTQRQLLIVTDNPGLVSQGEYGGEESREWDEYRSLVKGRNVIWLWESRFDHQQLVDLADDARCAAVSSYIGPAECLADAASVRV